MSWELFETRQILWQIFPSVLKTNRRVSNISMFFCRNSLWCAVKLISGKSWKWSVSTGIIIFSVLTLQRLMMKGYTNALIMISQPQRGSYMTWYMPRSTQVWTWNRKLVMAGSTDVEIIQTDSNTISYTLHCIVSRYSILVRTIACLLITTIFIFADTCNNIIENKH